MFKTITKKALVVFTIVGIGLAPAIYEAHDLITLGGTTGQTHEVLEGKPAAKNFVPKF